MAAPRFAPVPTVDNPKAYESPDHVPAAWNPDRPAEIEGLQPEGARLGYQGPDQGYALTLAKRCRDKIVAAPGETVDDAVRGCLNIALRRASLYGRAPMMPDLTIAFTIWGWYDTKAEAALIARRSELFEGVANTNHHYTEGRLIADIVPESTLRLTPDAAAAAYASGRWRDLTGA